MTSSEVVVIGDALLDVTARPASAVRAGGDVPGDVRLACGGQGANLAVRLARSHVAVELVCGLGDDPAAALVIDALAAEGVRVTRVPVAATGTVVILLDEHGERTMVSARAPFAARAPLRPAPMTIVSGYCFLERDAGRFGLALARVASRRVLVGCAVPGPARAAWREAVAGARPHLLILNRDEARELAPVEPLGAGVVVTSNEVVVGTVGQTRARIALSPSPDVVDATGAGDAFAAVLVATLLRQPWPPSEPVLAAALADAASAATQVANEPGAQALVPAETPR